MQSNSESHDSLEQILFKSKWKIVGTLIKFFDEPAPAPPKPNMCSRLGVGVNERLAHRLKRYTSTLYENRQIRVKRIHGPKGSVMLSQKLNILSHVENECFDVDAVCLS